MAEPLTGSAPSATMRTSEPRWLVTSVTAEAVPASIAAPTFTWPPTMSMSWPPAKEVRAELEVPKIVIGETPEDAS